MIKIDHVLAIGTLLVLVFALGFALGTESDEPAISLEELPVHQPCERPPVRRSQQPQERVF